MKVWIFQTGEPLHIDQDSLRPMRAMNLADFLISKGHSVTIWSSCFFHQKKIFRSSKNTTIHINSNLKYELIMSPGYTSNVSIKRLWDHFILSLNLKKALKKTSDMPDVAFLGFPPMETTYIASRWLKKNKIKYCVDIKDPWPTHLIEAFPLKLRAIVKLIFLPYFFITSYAIRNATSVAGISKFFINWANNLASRRKSANDFVFYLANRPVETSYEITLENDIWAQRVLGSKTRETNFLFVGTLASAHFDFLPIIQCAKYFDVNKYPVNFIICGDGEAYLNLKKECYSLKNVIFTGWVDYHKVVSLSVFSAAGLAPYVNNDTFKNTMSNKMLDYLSLKLPIISSINGECIQELSSERVAYIYSNKDELRDQLLLLHNNIDLLKTTKRNAYKLFLENYSYTKVYGTALKQLEEISS